MSAREGFRIDRERLVRMARDLVAIDSVNPLLVRGAAGEAEAAAYVARAAEELGLEVSVQEPEPGRPSVVARLPGAGGAESGTRKGATGSGRREGAAESGTREGAGRSLMLNAHLDTVGVQGMASPFDPVVRDGRLYGRGAYDMKGSVAACLAAAGALAARARAGAPLAGDLLVAAVADEEAASLGTAHLLEEGIRPDGAIVTEPTGLAVCLAHRGFVWMEIRVEGRAAHGSQWREGVDANLRMGRVLARLDALLRALRGRPPHSLLGPPTLHVGVLRGGTGPSTYAAESVCELEFRTLPGTTEADVQHEVRRILEELAAEDPEFRAAERVILARDAFEADHDAPIVRSVAAATRDVLSREPEFTGENPWMDSALLAAAGVDTAVIGPVGGGAHAAEEWVDVDSLERLAEILVQSAESYCGRG